MNRLDHFEALAERLVEGTFGRLFAGYLHPLEVATHLARAMEDEKVRALDGTFWAPTHYWIYLHPKDFGLLIVRCPSLADELREHIERLAQEAGLGLIAPPEVAVEPLQEIPRRSVRVEARWDPPEEVLAGSTRELSEAEREEIREGGQEIRGRPFLIIAGERHIELTGALVNIGRALDNDVILEDPRVSRHHAQLRRRYGRYILYDLGSSAGTTVNGYPVQECVLQPGDVLSFGGVEVVYGETPLAAPAAQEGDTPVLETGD